MTTPFDPQPCGTGGPGDAGADVEQTLLCDVGPNGDILGTALAVYEYDSDGNPTGPPTFVDPATGVAYVAQGVLQPCPGDVACGAPTQFCFTSTAPVDQPGRMYDTTLTLAQGFPVQALVKDLVETPLNIVWEVTDPDGTAFATALQTALQSQFPGQTVTVTPGVVDPCLGGTADFAVHIECLRIDQSPPTLLQFKYNSGRDQVINPAFLSVPDTGTFAFLKRQDSVSAVATGDVLCTSVAGRGWETNDINNSFETWGPSGNAYNIAAGTTPTPRGTVVQEINSYGSGPQTESPGFGDNPNTIWQTFTIPAAGNFTVRVVVGGRASTENIAIKLSTGDVNDAGIGDVINTSVNAVQVTNQDPLGNNSSNTPGPWTTFNQVVPLGAGTYTLAFTGPPKPAGVGGNAFGGLFTDMRVFQDAPNTIQPFVNDDETCVVPTNTTSTICEFWAPRCAAGDIVGWYNVADGEELTNAAFWAQVPAPVCCPTGSGDGGTGSTGNLVHTYLVCGTLNGERRTMSRVVVTDQSGGIIADTFVDTDGGPVTPDTWQPGDCSGGTPGFTEVTATCEALGSAERLGPDLIQNGDFASSAGTGTDSQEGPGWAANLTPSGDVSLANPATFALFNTSADTVSTESAANFQADSGSTLLVSADPTSPAGHLVYWKSAYLKNGATYRFEADMGNVAGTWAVQVGYGNDQLSDIHIIPDPGSSIPSPVTVDGVFNGPTGHHNINLTTITETSQVFALDNVRLREVIPAVAATPVTVLYSDTVRAVVDQVVPTAGCNDDRRDGLLTDVISQLIELRPDVPLAVEPPVTRDVEQIVLCDDNGPFVRVFQYGTDTGTPSGTPSDFTLAGAPYVPVGTVTSCPEGCQTASSIGTVCYTPPVAVQTLQDDWTGATSVLGGGTRTWTNANFAGAGITVTEAVTPDTGAALLGAAVRNTATSPATQHTVIDLGAPRNNVTIRLDFFGSGQGERLRNVTPAFGAVSGNGTAVLANTGVDAGPAADGTAFLNFPGPVQTISWDYSPTGGGLSGQSFISFNSGNASNSAPAAVLRDCDTGATTYVDLATGTVLNPAAISIVDCPSEIPADTTPAANPQIDSTVQRQTGAGAVNVASGARSITVTVLTGAPTVSIGGGAAVTLAAGLSLTWAVDQGGPAGETLQDSFVFTGLAGTDLIVNTTRAI